MAKYGVWMLEKLIVEYCPSGGSSRGMRAFIQTMMPQLVESNPQMQVKAVERRGRHPQLVACYRNGRSKPVCVKNSSPEAIQEAVYWLRNSHGRGQADTTVSKQQLTRNPSVQGVWTGATFASQLEAESARRAAALGALSSLGAAGSAHTQQ